MPRTASHRNRAARGHTVDSRAAASGTTAPRPSLVGLRAPQSHQHPARLDLDIGAIKGGNLGAAQGAVQAGEQQAGVAGAERAGWQGGEHRTHQLRQQRRHLGWPGAFGAGDAGEHLDDGLVLEVDRHPVLAQIVSDPGQVGADRGGLEIARQRGDEQHQLPQIRAQRIEAMVAALGAISPPACLVGGAGLGGLGALDKGLGVGDQRRQIRGR